MSDMISGISSAVSEALSGFSGKQGNIMIPVYVGGTLLDELVVTAQARQTCVRREVKDGIYTVSDF